MRKDTGKHSVTAGKFRFPELEESGQLRYAAFAAYTEFSFELVWPLYNQHVDCENRIRELKYGKVMEGVCLDDFSATEVPFRWTVIVHNLMILLRLQMINQKDHPV